MTSGNQTNAISKPWGRTRQIFRDATHEIWHASIYQGGYSSRHFHERKVNEFYVVSGTLIIRVYADRIFATPDTEHPIEEVTLGPGQAFAVPDKVWHMFEAVTQVELIETYYASLKDEDIHRHDQGGLKTS